MLKISIVETRNEIRVVLDCAGLIPMAEQELAAFFNAVTELFGSEQAELSAEDWLQELTAIGALPASAREWRLITATVSARLANRLRWQAAAGTGQNHCNHSIASLSSEETVYA